MTLTKNEIATALYENNLFLQRESSEFLELGSVDSKKRGKNFK